jgi:hypothetical protein
MQRFATHHVQVKLSHIALSPEALSEMLDVLVSDLRQHQLYVGKPDARTDSDELIISVPVYATQDHQPDAGLTQ